MPWILQKEEKYTLYTPRFSDVLAFEESLSPFKADVNKVIDCRSILLTPTAIDLIAKAYELHLSTQVSFIVVISDNEDMDRLEEHFVVVPTISEAIEYIYMEELEKNL
jgi:hypothetical protein